MCNLSYMLLQEFCLQYLHKVNLSLQKRFRLELGQYQRQKVYMSLLNNKLGLLSKLMILRAFLILSKYHNSKKLLEKW
jgi:hypothetical protein